MRQLPPLRSLEAFVQVARLGSARAAANELAISPSALSRRIASLESFMGKKLFRRQKQLLALNNDGEALYQSILPAFKALSDAVHSHQDAQNALRLRLGVLPLFGSQRLFPKLPDLRKLYPKLHIDINSSTHGEEMLGDTLDAAIILTEQVDPELHSVQLDENYIYAIASRELIDKLGDTPSPEMMGKQTYLIHNNMPESFIQWKKELGFTNMPDAAIDRFDSGPLMLEAAAQGLGIAIMHDNHLRKQDDRLAKLPGKMVKSPYSYWFVCMPSALEMRAVRLFHDWLVKADL